MLVLCSCCWHWVTIFCFGATMTSCSISAVPVQLKINLNFSAGRVPSPTLNELPTAEDVEAMIESMRAGETSLSANNGEEQPSRGSAPPPPSVATVSGTVESSPSQGPPSLAPQGTTVNGNKT